MADIDRMFRCELAVLAEQQAPSDLWALDAVFEPTPAVSEFGDAASHWQTSLDISAPADNYPPHADTGGHTALGLFPAPNRRLGGSTTPVDPFDPQPTVHLSDVSLGIAVPTPIHPPLQIPIASSSSAPITHSPTESLFHTDPSSEDMDSSDFDFDLAYPSDSDFLPSPTSIDPASLSAPSNATADAGILANPAAIRPSRRASRAMTKVPVPIPNLTKKSRGRKVPTSNGEPIFAASRDKTKKGVRTYTCHADGCGKCFVRGEHLKRHIRSIHTDEKPWMCTYENCDRAFSRRDNLNQHLRIHKLQDDDD